jgi:hypothetical protein
VVKRRPGQVATDALNAVEACLPNNPRAAKRLWEAAREGVRRALGGWQNKAIGERDRRLYTEIKTALCRPCPCLYCGFTKEQQHQVEQDGRTKATQLNCQWSSDDDRPGNAIGAYAEAVFGVWVGLPMNTKQGPDGGVDYSLPNGFTIDVKGTRYGKPPRLAEGFRQTISHMFVYIQIVEGRHVFFLGFAFANDRFRHRTKKFFGDRPDGYEPEQLRSLDQFKTQVMEFSEARHNG